MAIDEFHRILTENNEPIAHMGFIILDKCIETYTKRWDSIRGIEEILDCGHLPKPVLVDLHNQHYGSGGCFASAHTNRDGVNSYFLVSMDEQHEHAKHFASASLPDAHLHTKYKGPKHVIAQIKIYLSKYLAHSPRSHTAE